MCRRTARRACKRAGASATWDESGCTHDAPLSQFQKISDVDPESRSCPAQPSDACSYLCSYPCSYPFEKCVRPSRGLASCPWMVLRLLEKDNYKDKCRDNYRHRSAAAIGTSRAVSFVEFFFGTATATIGFRARRRRPPYTRRPTPSLRTCAQPPARSRRSTACVGRLGPARSRFRLLRT